MNRHTIFLLILFVLIVSSFSNHAFCQLSLKEQLTGKNTLSDIMLVVDQYYKDHPEDIEGDEKEFESPHLQWKRWEWYMSGRLGHGGKFVNIPKLLMDGLDKKEKMKGSTERNINSEWTFVGPSTTPLLNPEATGNGIGRVDRIVFHPTNANIIFICTPAGGLWNTLDGGSTWNNLTDHLPAVGISGFVISYANPSIQYILTGDGDSNLGPNGFVQGFGFMRPSIGVLKSIDGGISWHQTGIFPQVDTQYVGYKLIQSTADPELLIAATSNGIYRTTNGGTTWTKELARRSYDVAFKPGDPTRVYASVFGDFWISTNSGDSWTSNSTYDIDPGDCINVGNGETGGRIQIAVAPSNPNRVYLLAGPVTGAGFCGLWLSDNSGASFTRQSNTPNVLGAAENGIDSVDFSEYALAIAVLPTLSSAISVAGCTIWRSANSGISWSHSTSYFETGGFPYIHPDVHELKYNPLNNYLYAASDGGLYKSTDFGVTWTNLSANIETSQLYHMAGWDGNINKLMAGFQDNGIKYRNANNAAFNHIDGGDGFDVVFNPDTGEPAFGTRNRSIVKFWNNGASDSTVTPSGYLVYFKTLAIHNTNPDTILLGSYNIVKSTNAGANWSTKNGSGSWSLASCPSNSSRFYSAGGSSYNNGAGSLYFSGDIGETWTNKSQNAGFPDASHWIKITDVAVMPTNSSYVWACFGGFDDGYKVVMSTNTGNTWDNLTFNLPNVPINCLAIDSDNGAYAGTDIGVFYLGPTVSEWMPWSNGLPNVPVTELVIFDDGANKKIRAATFGRGVWQGNPASSCDASVIVSGGLEGINHFEASNSISSSSVVQGGIGTFVSFQSGNYITLTEGFNVVGDSEFLGFISPCGQGGIPSVVGDGMINRADPSSSIILLRRMWDVDDGLPYGSIEVSKIDHERAKINFKTRKPGQVEIYAARRIQDNLVKLYSGNTSSGYHTIDADISGLNREFYYVVLFFEGKLAHYQEMDLRQ